MDRNRSYLLQVWSSVRFVWQLGTVFADTFDIQNNIQILPIALEKILFNIWQ